MDHPSRCIEKIRSLEDNQSPPPPYEVLPNTISPKLTQSALGKLRVGLVKLKMKLVLYTDNTDLI